MLTEIITPADCSMCKLCCNFLRSSSWETPSLEKELIYLLQEEAIPLTRREDGSTTFFLDYRTNSNEECALCPMLSTESGCTLPRELRPFECRIWPLRMMRNSGKMCIGLYKNCPALDTQRRASLINLARHSLLPAILDYAKKHPLAVREMNPAYDIIWQED